MIVNYHLWWLLMLYDGSWWLMIMHDDQWLMILRWLMMVDESSMVVHDGACEQIDTGYWELTIVGSKGCQWYQQNPTNGRNRLGLSGSKQQQASWSTNISMIHTERGILRDDNDQPSMIMIVEERITTNTYNKNVLYRVNSHHEPALLSIENPW